MTLNMLEEDINLFKKLDRIIKENGGYLIRDKQETNDAIIKENNFKKAIESFDMIVSRNNQGGALSRSEYISAEHYKNGIKTLFADNPNLSSPKIAEKIMKICKDEVFKTSGQGKFLLLDTMNECLKESNISLSLIPTNLLKQKHDYYPINYYNKQVVISGLTDSQINESLSMLIKISGQKNLNSKLDEKFVKEFKKQINNLDKGLSGNNTLNDDNKILSKLEKLNLFIDKHLNQDLNKLYPLLNDIKNIVINSKNYIKKIHEQNQNYDVSELNVISDNISLLDQKSLNSNKD